eukprot:scaffold211635_cov36-Attheya_sp.AAC.1
MRFQSMVLIQCSPMHRDCGRNDCLHISRIVLARVIKTGGIATGSGRASNHGEMNSSNPRLSFVSRFGHPQS